MFRQIHVVLSKMNLVFTYGTLKRGQPNNYLLENPENGKMQLIGDGKTVKRFPLVIASSFNIPFLLYAEGKGMAFQYNAFLDDFQFQGRKGSVAGCINAALPLSIMKTKAGAGDTSFFLSILNIKPPELQKKQVQGQIYEVDDQMLSVLDKLESHPHVYQRMKTQIIRSEPASEVTECWCYFLTDYIPDLLKLPPLESYDAYGTHGLNYIKPSDRPSEVTKNYWVEVKLEEKLK